MDEEICFGCYELMDECTCRLCPGCFELEEFCVCDLLEGMDKDDED